MMTVSQLAMLTVVAVASLRSLPAMADYGLASILLYLIPAVVFLVPTALVAAELATGWKGGVYVWVREAFGNRIGFLAIWLQWIQKCSVVSDTDCVHRRQPVVCVRHGWLGQ